MTTEAENSTVDQSATKSSGKRLSGANTLPTASLKLTSVKGSGEIGGAAAVGVAFRNRGVTIYRVAA